MLTNTVPTRPPCPRQMRLRSGELPGRRGRRHLVPHALLLPHAQGETGRLRDNVTLAGNAL